MATRDEYPLLAVAHSSLIANVMIALAARLDDGAAAITGDRVGRIERNDVFGDVHVTDAHSSDAA